MLCPECKIELAEVSAIAGEGSDGPKAGDLAVCGACASINRYSEDGTFQVATPDQLANADSDLRSILEGCQRKVLADRTAHIIPGKDPEEIQRAGVVVALKPGDFEGSSRDCVERSCRRCKSPVLVDARALVAGVIFLCTDCAADLIRAGSN